MENIVIKKTLDYGSKGELIVQKDGKVTIEVVDPKSLREIINYAKNNFYELEDVIIDEENFSFKYGDYRVTFEFFKSYDFFRDNIRNLKKGTKPEKIIFINRHELIVDFGDFKLKLRDFTSYIEIDELLRGVKEQKSDVYYHIEKNNLYTKSNGIIIELQDYKRFVTNRNFKYIFDNIQKRKLKVVKDTIISGFLIFASTITGVVFLKTQVEADETELMKEALKEPDTKYVSVEPMPEHITTEEFIPKTTYVDSEPETLVDKPEQNLPITTQVTIVDYDEKYKDFGIGSLANDEKLLTAKRLYFDLIEKYSRKYGLDPYLMLVVATQERGIHSSTIDDKGAIGLMQIQVSVWKNKSLTVFDYDKNEEVTITFTMDMISSLEGNIEASCVVMQHYKDKMNGNYFAGLQSYNNGPSTVYGMIDQYSNSSGKSEDEIIFGNDVGWYQYRSDEKPGDPNYSANVLRYFVGDIRNLEQNTSKVMS